MIFQKKINAFPVRFNMIFLILKQRKYFFIKDETN